MEDSMKPIRTNSHTVKTNGQCKQAMTSQGPTVNKEMGRIEPVACWRQWFVGLVPVAVTTVCLVRAARYLNLRTHSPEHPVLNTQLRTPIPHRIPLELRSHRPRPITLVSLQGRLPNLHRLCSPAIHNVSWMLRTWRLTGWRIHSPQV